MKKLSIICAVALVLCLIVSPVFSQDADSDSVPKDVDNYHYAQNGPDVGTCTSGIIGESCKDNGNCGSERLCIINQEDTYTQVVMESETAGIISVCEWKECKKGAASFSIDDACPSCKDELEAAGFRGTYYLNGDNFNLFWSEYADAGHEISSHTVNHPCNAPCNYPDIYTCDYTQTDVDNYRIDELEPNIYAIESITGKPVLSLAWPCGCTDIIRESAASYYYLGARGYYDDICNFDWVQGVENQTPDDFYNLHSINSYDQAFIDQAISEGTWAIIISHSFICDGIDYMGSKKEDLYLAPVGEILKYVKIRDAAKFINYSRTDDKIEFTAFHTLPEFVVDSIVYPLMNITLDDEVTLKVSLNVIDEVFCIKINTIKVPFTEKTIDGNSFVIFNTSLDSQKHVEILMQSGIDSDNDGVGEACDNCSTTPNASELGTCVKTKAGMVVSYRVGDPKAFITCTSDVDCEATGGTCQLEQGDYNANGCGDVCECYADFNGDGKVTGRELGILIQEYGRFDCSELDPCYADGNEDGRVTGADLGLLKSEYGRFDCPACP